MAEYDEVIASGSMGPELVTVPSYVGEENPGYIPFSGKYAVVRKPDGQVRYNFGLAHGLFDTVTGKFGSKTGMPNMVSVNRPLAISYAGAGSETAKAALRAVPTPK